MLVLLVKLRRVLFRAKKAFKSTYPDPNPNPNPNPSPSPSPNPNRRELRQSFERLVEILREAQVVTAKGMVEALLVKGDGEG